MAAKFERLTPGAGETDAREQGSSLVAILSVVATLGVLVAITLTVSLGTSTAPPRTHRSSAAATTTTTAPRSVASGASEATLAACEANFTIVNSAIQTYRALNGNYPPAGTAWATSSANSGPIMTTWPSGAPSYRLVWNGRQLSVVPANGSASHGSIGQDPAASGCFAVKAS
jgi:hypothetical protein